MTKQAITVEILQETWWKVSVKCAELRMTKSQMVEMALQEVLDRLDKAKLEGG